ncbi:hypothetical protein [Streptomyces sp. NPDC048445]|uniref:hypothetical protein n=1 Tax=Streptomyces sp. NPDC048445 TaxID=3365553 RepID=UPI00371E66A2
MTTQTESAPEFVELITADGARYRKGDLAPSGLGIDEFVTVESLKESGDWVEIGLSHGYVLSVPETRIAQILTRTV